MHSSKSTLSAFSPAANFPYLDAEDQTLAVLLTPSFPSYFVSKSYQLSSQIYTEPDLFALPTLLPSGSKMPLFLPGLFAFLSELISLHWLLPCAAK